MRGNQRNMITPRSRFWGAVFLLFLVWISALVLGGRGFAPDLALYRELYVAADSQLGRNAVVFTHIGDGLVLSALAIIAAGYLAIHRKRRAALMLITVFGGR